MSSQLQLRLETSPTRNSRINETLRIDQQDKGPEPPPWPATPAHHTAWSLVRILSIYVSGWKITTPNNSAPLGCSYLTTGLCYSFSLKKIWLNPWSNIATEMTPVQHPKCTIRVKSFLEIGFWISNIYIRFFLLDKFKIHIFGKILRYIT